MNSPRPKELIRLVLRELLSDEERCRISNGEKIDLVNDLLFYVLLGVEDTNRGYWETKWLDKFIKQPVRSIRAQYLFRRSYRILEHIGIGHQDIPNLIEVLKEEFGSADKFDFNQVWSIAGEP
jgi:hypothetical protein